jgi:hypothetical protein
VPCGLVMPAAWTAAALYFTVSHDGTTFQPLGDNFGSVYTFTPTAAYNYALDFGLFLPWRFVRIQSGTVALAVNQGAARALTLITRPM